MCRRGPAPAACSSVRCVSIPVLLSQIGGLLFLVYGAALAMLCVFLCVNVCMCIVGITMLLVLILLLKMCQGIYAYSQHNLKTPSTHNPCTCPALDRCDHCIHQRALEKVVYDWSMGSIQWTGQCCGGMTVGSA